MTKIATAGFQKSFGQDSIATHKQKLHSLSTDVIEKELAGINRHNEPDQ
jgi:hypothetical protein